MHSVKSNLNARAFLCHQETNQHVDHFLKWAYAGMQVHCIHSYMSQLYVGSFTIGCVHISSSFCNSGYLIWRQDLQDPSQSMKCAVIPHSHFKVIWSKYLLDQAYSLPESRTLSTFKAMATSASLLDLIFVREQMKQAIAYMALSRAV